MYPFCQKTERNGRRMRAKKREKFIQKGGKVTTRREGEGNEKSTDKEKQQGMEKMIGMQSRRQ